MFDTAESLVDDGQEHVHQDERDGPHEEEEEDGAEGPVGICKLLEMELAKNGADEGLTSVDEV